MRPQNLWLGLLAGLLLSACGSDCPKDAQPGLTVTASDRWVEANGWEPHTLTATGVGFDCDPLPAGTLVTFRLTDWEPDFQPFGEPRFENQEASQTVATNAAGATVRLTSLDAGKATIVAEAQAGRRLISSDPLSVEFSPPSCCDSCVLSLRATPASLPADQASTTVTLTARLLVGDGIPPPNGTEVYFETSLGIFTECGQAWCTTASEGDSAIATLQIDEQCPEPVRVQAEFSCDLDTGSDWSDLSCEP